MTINSKDPLVRIRTGLIRNAEMMQKWVTQIETEEGEEAEGLDSLRELAAEAREELQAFDRVVAKAVTFDSREASS